MPSNIDFILQKTKALKEARGKATPGEWESFNHYGKVGVSAGPIPICSSNYPHEKQSCDDQEFIALAANEATRFADALEVVAKEVSKHHETWAHESGECSGECSRLCKAIAQAAEILRGEK